MPDQREIRAGIFVVLALVLLVAGTIWIAGFTPFAGEHVSYEVLMKGSSGVRRGDRLRIAGIQAGRIDRVELRAGSEWPVRFHVSVAPEVIVVEGSQARISTDGLLGAPYLEIVSGPPDQPQLPPGSEILGVEGGDIVQTLQGLSRTTERLPELIDGVVELVGELNEGIDPLLAGLQALLSEENVNSISRAMNSLSETLDELFPRLPGLIDDLETLADALESGLDEIPPVAVETRKLIEELRTALGPDGSRLAELLATTETTLETADGLLNSVQGGAPELERLLRDLSSAAENLKSLSQQLKERPSSLLRSPRLPERQPVKEPEEQP